MKKTKKFQGILIKNFNEVNFKNWLKNAKVSEYSHLSDEVLKKARSIA